MPKRCPLQSGRRSTGVITEPTEGAGQATPTRLQGLYKYIPGVPEVAASPAPHHTRTRGPGAMETGPSGEGKASPAAAEVQSKGAVVAKLAAVKRSSGKTYAEVASATGLTNVYVAQLLRRQAQLSPRTAPALRAALPGLTDELIEEMMLPPLRSYHPDLIQDPAIYRLNEAVMHFGESIKDIINEEFGDGIMSAIDFYCSVDKVKGADGKDRVVVTFDGKYLPYTEQWSENMVSKLKL